jgi:hypothetical protein
VSFFYIFGFLTCFSSISEYNIISKSKDFECNDSLKGAQEAQVLKKLRFLAPKGVLIVFFLHILIDFGLEKNRIIWKKNWKLKWQLNSRWWPAWFHFLKVSNVFFSNVLKFIEIQLIFVFSWNYFIIIKNKMADLFKMVEI